MNNEYRVNWRQYAAIFVGGSLCLPILMIGYQLCKQYGPLAAAAAIGIGNIFLFLLSIIMINITMVCRQTTLGVARQVFGRWGVPVFGCVMVGVMLGWFAIQLGIIATNISLLVTSYVGFAIPECSVCPFWLDADRSNPRGVAFYRASCNCNVVSDGNYYCMCSCQNRIDN